jgi:TatD DNase family protein
MTLTDTHCHLNFYDFDQDRAHIITRAWDTGLKRILIPGIDLPTSRTAVEFAESYRQIFAAVGVHPNSANKWDTRTIGYLDEMTSHQKVIAVGEIGLDYFRDWAAPQLQKRIFIEQLNLAQHIGLPVVIHTRNASHDDRNCIEETLEILSDIKINGVLHSFSGNISEAQQAIDLGFYLGITGPVTFKDATELQKVVASVPLDRLLIETDSPFLAPVPYRGKRNEPAFVNYVAEKIGEIHNQPVDSVAKITSDNADRLFKWGG